MVNNEKKLRPAVFISGSYNYNRVNPAQENLLLKAMGKSDDPKMWKKMAGINSMANLWKTLDKLSIRKEYHKALVRNGVDLDTIVAGIADIAKNGSNDNVKLKAFTTFLKSVGMDEYKESEDQLGKNWEDSLRDIIESEDKDDIKKELSTVEEYEVTQPTIPDEEIKRMDEEKVVGDNLYE